MKAFICTPISFMIIGILLIIETAGSDEVEKDIPPLCRFKLCRIGRVPQSIRVTKDLESENDSADIDSTLETFENEEMESTENIVEEQSDIAPSKKLCLFKLCSAEPIVQKSREENKNY